jgi:hypothetical protein
MVRDFANVATARKVQVSYVKAAAEAFVNGGLLPLRWVFCSGAFAERDGEKKLWFIEETRKIKVCQVYAVSYLSSRFNVPLGYAACTNP